MTTTVLGYNTYENILSKMITRECILTGANAIVNRWYPIACGPQVMVEKDTFPSVVYVPLFVINYNISFQ